MNVGSLFSGIGGFDLGFERAGMRTAWFCEQDEFCKRVLDKHWPGVPCYPDITQLRASDVEPVDVLCGGFPCQDISLAGKGAGITGARSGLWSEYARLVGELRPRYVVVENVPALRKRGLEKVLADLMALGYDAEWDGISASAVGAPHKRDRIWIVAYPCSDELRKQSGGGVREGRASASLADVDGSVGNVANATGGGQVASRSLGERGAA
jgi:DNA (cytosine-5)-methyltransferase 1